MLRRGGIDRIGESDLRGDDHIGGALARAQISTTDVVAPAVVGVGSGERWRHVRPAVVREIGLARLVTLPVSGALANLLLPFWRWWRIESGTPWSRQAELR
jgi:hypothetical protein